MTTIGGTVVASVERAPWGWVLTLAVITALIKGWPAIADAALRAKMALGDRRISRIEKLEARLDAKEIQHEAERAYDRHRINNLATALNAFFLLVKTNPDDAARAAEEIEVMRAKQIAEEHKENIALRALIASLVAEKGKDI